MPSEPSQRARARKRLALALVLSQLILWIGIIWAWRYGLETNQMDHQMRHTRDAVLELRGYLEKAPKSKP